MCRIIFDVANVPARQDVMILNLKDVEDPKPTEKMIHVLHNLRNYGYISSNEHDKAVNSFILASSYIEQHQKAMHDEVARNIEAYEAYQERRSTSRGRRYRVGSDWDDDIYSCLDPSCFY
jgi:hypothetical protein